MADTAPYEIPPSVLAPASQRLVLHRRGSTVWQVETEQGRYAVKLGYPIEATPEWPAQEWTALAPAREGTVLQQLNRAGVSFGEWDHGTWNIQPWYAGTSLYDLWRPHRVDDALSEPDPGEASSCAEAVAELHASGWVHGDIQPAHLITSTAGTKLIDLALAHGGHIPPSYDFSYRGCLVHYESPEVSRAVLTTGTATPTQAADVYALGASLFISATGLRHVAYPDDASRPDQRRAVVEGPHRPVDVPGTLGRLIEAMLSPNPTDRPTSREVHGELINAS
ncbi:protein kinase [Streptomyces sp. NPDC020412]|uniref:protein kinase domain-containing protein n=1 Tax=Streptomyces sp. NPDC020412 TaxID=3365073 RepID=UPI0037B10145